MRATAKGRVTIPPEVREALGIDEHTELEWELRDSEAVLRVTSTDREKHARELVERMVGRGNYRWTTDELLRITRGDDWNQSAPS